MKINLPVFSLPKSLSLAAVLLALAVTAGQAGTLNGTVRKLTDSTFVSGAKIVMLVSGVRTDSLTTDSIGGYSFLDVATGNNKQLIVTGSGYATVTSGTLNVFQSTSTVTTNFYLGAPANLSGAVRRSVDSVALVGAWVYLRRTSTNSTILDSVQSNAQGAFAFANLTPGTPNYFITAVFSPYATNSNSNIVVGSGANVVSNIYLQPILPGSISGKVLKGSDSTALVGAKLLLRRGNSDTTAVLDSAVSDASGNYTFANLVAGSPNYRIATTLSPYVANSATNIVVNNGANTTLNIYLLTPGKITGKVLKASDSSAVSQALVVLRRGTSDTTAILDSARTAVDGSYTFSNLTASTGGGFGGGNATRYRVMATFTGFSTASATNITVSNGVTTTSNLYLGVPGSIAGKVRSASDSVTVLAGASVYLRRSSTFSSPLDSTVTDAQGNYSFTNVAFGTPNYFITASLTGYNSATNSNVVVASGTSVTSNLYLSLVARGKIYGTVRKATDSTSLSGTLVVLRRGSDTVAIADSVRADSTGRFVFADVLAGTPNYWLTASRTGYLSQTLSNIAVAANDSAAANFFLSIPLSVGPSAAFRVQGFTAKRFGAEWKIGMPVSTRTRTFRVVDLQGVTRYQAVVPAGLNQIMVPAAAVVPGSLLSLQ